MKHVVLWGLICSVLAGGVAAAQVPSEPPDRVREDYSAEASWVIPTGKPGRARWLAIVGERTVERADSKEATYGFVIRGQCRRDDEFTMCSGSGPWVELDGGGFEMAPDMSSAHIEIRHKGRAYSAHIEANGLLDLFLSSEHCFMLSEDEPEDEGSGQGGGAYRSGAATGNFDGREMGPETGRASAILMSGAMLTSCKTWWPRYWINDDGTAGAVWRFPTAR